MNARRVTRAARPVWLRICVFSILACSAMGLTACDYYFPPPEQRYRAIDVYEDRYGYRFNTYTNARRLSIAIQATTDDVEELHVRDCVSNERLTEVLDVLRVQGQSNVSVTLPDDC